MTNELLLDAFNRPAYGLVSIVGNLDLARDVDLLVIAGKNTSPTEFLMNLHHSLDAAQQAYAPNRVIRFGNLNTQDDRLHLASHTERDIALHLLAYESMEHHDWEWQRTTGTTPKLTQLIHEARAKASSIRRAPLPTNMHSVQRLYDNDLAHAHLPPALAVQKTNHILSYIGRHEGLTHKAIRSPEQIPSALWSMRRELELAGQATRDYNPATMYALQAQRGTSSP